METRSFSDDLRRYIGLLRHWAWLLILFTLLAGGIAYFLTKRMTPIYQASTTILINEAPSIFANLSVHSDGELEEKPHYT